MVAQWMYALVVVGVGMLLIRNAAALDKITSALVSAMRDVWSLGGA